jgi:hypothetical protein
MIFLYRGPGTADQNIKPLHYGAVLIHTGKIMVYSHAFAA